MIPLEQKVVYFWDGGSLRKSLESFCEEYIKEGYVIHQIIPHKGSGCYHLLLYKY